MLKRTKAGQIILSKCYNVAEWIRLNPISGLGSADFNVTNIRFFLSSFVEEALKLEFDPYYTYSVYWTITAQAGTTSYLYCLIFERIDCWVVYISETLFVHNQSQALLFITKLFELLENNFE